MVAVVVSGLGDAPSSRPNSSVHRGAVKPRTFVSLTFDDGIATQYQARSLLRSHGMHATFFVISGRLGRNRYYMTWAQVRALAADGNEIGGHTVDHARLTALPADHARRQICDDRRRLLQQGFRVTDFAYPYGRFSGVESLVRGCGYNSGRTVRSPKGMSYRESIRATDPFATRTAPPIEATTSLQTMKRWVTQVEAQGGGWLQLVFHRVCDRCGWLAIPQARLRAFLGWLKPRANSGTVVRTVHQVIGGPLKPPPS